MSMFRVYEHMSEFQQLKHKSHFLHFPCFLYAAPGAACLSLLNLSGQKNTSKSLEEPTSACINLLLIMKMKLAVRKDVTKTSSLQHPLKLSSNAIPSSSGLGSYHHLPSWSLSACGLAYSVGCGGRQVGYVVR